MNVMLISQCSKQALPITRRILDQFAERKGDRTWLTPITQAGLESLHTLLRQKARRNTAVACHWIKGGQIELLWVVGNRNKFNFLGTVPTNHTARKILSEHPEDNWRHTQSIALMAGIAGLFHDWGKANSLFQSKLRGTRKTQSEPVRHEWVSLRLFEAFVGNRKDTDWLQKLSRFESELLNDREKKLYKDGVDAPMRNNSTLVKFRGRPVAWIVSWLILSHHKLPDPPDRETLSGSDVDRWQRKLKPEWNSPQFSSNFVNTEAENSEKGDCSALWNFEGGLPDSSTTWRNRAQILGQRAVKHTNLLKENWIENPFVMHISRCSLMLADHCYSAQETTPRWQDTYYRVYANTRPGNDVRLKGAQKLKQQLDEHCIGVSHHAYFLARSLPRLRSQLPSLGDVRPLRKNSSGHFAWQNRAFHLGKQTAQLSQSQGGFYINMASTGTGKTLANARLAFGLSNSTNGCRFNILLGLRTLTLQTGEALRARTGLRPGDLAVLVGSSAVREIFEKASQARHERTKGYSESSADLFQEHGYVKYDGQLDQSRVGSWLRQKNRDGKNTTLHKLISAPVLVSTIDYLMPATESARGGRQIGPMLRLLTADTILDEPDDFDLNDQPALCRLVNFIGLFGGRVVISSATLPPSLLEALFDSYASGRQHYNSMLIGTTAAVQCGWVDEFNVQQEPISELGKFQLAHKRFVLKRLKSLKEKHPIRRRAELVTIRDAVSTPWYRNYAATIGDYIPRMHDRHHQSHSISGHRVSIGLVRMANIDPLVAVVKELAILAPPEDTEIYYCIYHARHLLLRRACIETELDSLLDRTDPESLWKHDSIVNALKSERKNIIFVVVATAVAEVGRDHDYDWAIVEPSSVRSIVQLAGRVKRHRLEPEPVLANMLLLEKNVRALRNDKYCFTKPGYESKKYTLSSHTLVDILPPDHYQFPSPISRIKEPDDPSYSNSLIDIEHVATRDRLLGDPQELPACLWWQEPTQWCYFLQQKSRFRASRPQDFYVLETDEDGLNGKFMQYTEGETIEAEKDKFCKVALTPTDHVHFWPVLSDAALLASVSTGNDNDITTLCRRYLTVSLDQSENGLDVWRHNDQLGIFRR